MEKNESYFEAVDNLYESLDVSERAQDLFLENIVLNENGALDLALKVFYKNNKPEKTIPKMVEALNGMMQVVQASPLVDEATKNSDLAILQDFVNKVNTAGMGLVNADQEMEKVKKSLSKISNKKTNQLNKINKLNK